MKHLLLTTLTCITLLASSVHVKYFGDIDLEGYNKQPLFYSTFVKELYYNPKQQKAIVKLKNTYYMYCNIFMDEIIRWTSSGSLGKYYNKNIKGKRNEKNIIHHFSNSFSICYIFTRQAQRGEAIHLHKNV